MKGAWGTTGGAVKGTRRSLASFQVSSLIGVLHTGNALQNLINRQSTAGLNAQGTSVTNSSLTIVLGGHVIEVLFALFSRHLTLSLIHQKARSYQAKPLMLAQSNRKDDDDPDW